MADMNLKVTPDEVRNKAKEIQSVKVRMQDMMTEMQRQVNSLQTEHWKSQSGADYAGKYQSVSKNINGALETLMTHINNLVETANKYDELERNQVQNVQSLSTQDIFN